MEFRSLIATALLCTLVVLAGCEGAIGDLRETTPTSTPEPSVAAPGVATTGVTDVDRLAAAHRDSLQDRSYTVLAVVRIELINGSRTYRRVTRLKVDTAHRQFWLRQNASGPFPHELEPRRNFDAWSDGNFTYVRSTTGNETDNRTEFQRFNPTSAPVNAEMLNGQSAIRSYLGAVNRTTVTEVSRDGWIAYEIRTVGDRFQPYAIRAVVDTFGMIHALTVRYPVDTEFGPAIATYRFEYSGVGTTTVTAPDWVSKARNRTSVLMERPLCTGDQALGNRKC
ncbi:MAG: hypothetical protein SVG88_05140 [Halobacteriales archaeon]|nr:hypothetical protein [Halobacteriales archaeon]